MSRFVYADNAATTPVLPEVAKVMNDCFLQDGMYGNPSSLYKKGQEANKALNDARARIASILNCKPAEIFFTSCGSESDNWAIKGAAQNGLKKGRNRIVTSKIEHHAVLHTCETLERQGFEVVYVGTDCDGVISLSELEAAVNDKTAVVAIMMANNEVGTVQPIAEAAEIAHKHGALMFTDAVQAVGNMKIDLSELDVDMLAMSGHKIHAPKGIGLLFVRKGKLISNLIDGGGQEQRRRGGTENLPYILGLARAIELANGRLGEIPELIRKRDRLIDEITARIPYSKLNGHRTQRLPGNVNIGFEFIEGESMLLMLDVAGICASTGSACSSASLEASHVLLAMGVPHEKAHGSLRLSISYETTDEDIDYIIETLPPIVARLRDMSPLWEDMQKDKI